MHRAYAFGSALAVAAMLAATLHASPVPVATSRAGPEPSPSPSESPSPSPTPTGPSELTITVAPAAAVWGTTFRIGGFLRCAGQPIAAAPVTIRKRTGGSSSFSTIGEDSTDTEGRYEIEHKPATSADYQAIILGGTGACGVSSSAIAPGDVRVGIATNVTRSTLPRGWTAELRGVVLPAHPGRKVYLQVFQGTTRTWSNAAVAVLDASSRYRLTYRRTSPGRLLLRAVFPKQDADHTWNIGRNLSVTWT